jgi:hypothetical protein
MARKKKQKKDKEYFTNAVDQAIIEYNLIDNYDRKNILYKDTIYPAFDKLAENLINTYKCTYIDLPYEDLKHELVVFYTEKIGRFNQEAGKAFSYFTKVGINYLIALNNRCYSIQKRSEDLLIIDEERDIMNEVYREDFKNTLQVFTQRWLHYVDSNLNKIFTNPEDAAVADSILELFRSRFELETFNKKALYILVRERTNLKTHRITKVLGILKRDFYGKLEQFRT